MSLYQATHASNTWASISLLKDLTLEVFSSLFLQQHLSVLLDLFISSKMNIDGMNTIKIPYIYVVNIKMKPLYVIITYANKNLNK
jgi:hypothetical protein